MKLTLGETLRLHRQRQHLSTRDVARQAKVSASTISRMENDKPVLALALLSVCRVLGVSVDEWMKETEEEG